MPLHVIAIEEWEVEKDRNRADICPVAGGAVVEFISGGDNQWFLKTFGIHPIKL